METGSTESLESLLNELVAHVRFLDTAVLPKAWLSAVEVEIPRVDSVKVESATNEINHVETTETEMEAEPVRTNLATIVSTDEASGAVANLDWAELETLCKGCTACRLCETRNNVVFGVGKRDNPLIMFVGEGPGADEDRIGEPFVGRAGKLLTAAITQGMGLRREDVYIGNVVKCRPPENRAPLPDEVAACTPYLYRQIELLKPKVIVTLGQPAQMCLSGVNLGITKLRGQWQNWKGIKLMPTFHPAYILRNPSAKKFFWEDLKSVMQEVGLKVPGGKLE